MAKRLPPSDPGPEEELSVVVLKFKGTGETIRKGVDAAMQAIASLGGTTTVIKHVNGRKAAQLGAGAAATDTIDAESVDETESEDEEPETPPAAPKAKRTPGAVKYSFLDDFDLAPAGKVSLKDFVAGKTAATENDRYLLVSLWLQTEGGTDPFTGNHVFTCLRALGWKYRQDVNAPVREMKSKKSWFASPAYGKWKLTQPGIDAANAVQ